jgi:hypothetical protein
VEQVGRIEHGAPPDPILPLFPAQDRSGRAAREDPRWLARLGARGRRARGVVEVVRYPLVQRLNPPLPWVGMKDPRCLVGMHDDAQAPAQPGSAPVPSGKVRVLCGRCGRQKDVSLPTSESGSTRLPDVGEVGGGSGGW